MHEILSGAKTLLAIGKFAEAKAEFAQYIKICPNDAEGYVGAFLAEHEKRTLTAFVQEAEYDELESVPKDKHIKLALKHAEKELGDRLDNFLARCSQRARSLAEAVKREKEIRKVYDYENGVILQSRKSQSGDVTIPDGVTGIGELCFKGCKAITSITVPSGVKTIGAGAFTACKSLRTLTIPDSVEVLESDLCCDCVNLREVKLPAKLEVVPQRAFWNCSSLTHVDLPAGVIEIANSAFEGCYDLKEIKLPKKLKIIGEYAFYGCYDVVEVTIPDGVEFIGKKAFARCKDLQKVTMPKALKKYKKQAFKTGLFSKCKFIYT